MDRRKQTGQRGEDIAAAYFAGMGYEIVARNWRCSGGELDIIMEKDGILIFVEVRTRRSLHYGLPEESITPTKQARLIALAETYLQETKALDRSWRIDVAAVDLGSDSPQINHIQNAVGW